MNHEEHLQELKKLISGTTIFLIIYSVFGSIFLTIEMQKLQEKLDAITPACDTRFDFCEVVDGQLRIKEWE